MDPASVVRSQCSKIFSSETAWLCSDLFFLFQAVAQFRTDGTTLWMPISIASYFSHRGRWDILVTWKSFLLFPGAKIWYQPVISGVLFCA